MSRLLHEIVAEHAERSPEKIAVVDGEVRWSYAELLERSARLAGNMRRKHHVRPGDFVALDQPRSAGLVASALAVLQCGAAYAALDPAWPAGRKRDLADKMNACAVIEEPCEGRTVAPVAPPHGTDSVATVFFTSGTTGGPKGILSPHRALARLFPVSGAMDLRHRPALPLAAAVPWDGLALEMWGALCSGGTAVVVREPLLLPSRMRELIIREGISVCWLTASVFAMYVDEDLGAFQGLRQVLTGGERVSTAHARRFLQAHHGIGLVNGYGPAENAVFATTHRVRLQDTDSPRLPVGRAVQGTEVHLIDGEICLSGTGLALGYLADGQLSRQRFADVDLGDRTERMYRTGDLGRWTEEGLLDCLGRSDRQVKINGIRVEPTETEETLLSLPGVVQAAVVPVSTEGGGFTGMRAFVLGDVNADECMERLRALLPGYLVPARIDRIEQTPLTINGKLDVPALLAAHPWRQEPARARVAPHPDPAVPAICAHMAEVLGLPAVDPDDDFFALGGTSMLAARLCVRLDKLGYGPVDVSTLLSRPTPSGLVQLLDPSQGDRYPALLQHVPPKSSDSVAVMPGQLPFLIAALSDPDDLTALCPMLWEHKHEIHSEAMRAALLDVTNRHEALRACYRMTDDGPVALPQTSLAPPELTVVDSDDQVLSMLLRPLHIESGEIWRAASGPGLFGIVVHHIAIDAAAAGMLARDLSEAYRARRTSAARPFEGGQASSPPLAVVAAERARLLRADIRTQKDYWRQALHGSQGMKWPSVEGADGLSAYAAELSGEHRAKLGHLTRHHATTRTAVLLAAAAQALSEVAGTTDICFGIPVSRRESVVMQSALTCLIEMVCLRVRSPGIAAAHQALLDGIAHRDVPIHEVARLSGRQQPYQVVLVTQEDDEPVLDLGDGRTCRYRWTDTSDLDVDMAIELLPGDVLRVSVRSEVVDPAVAWTVCTGILTALNTIP